MDKVGFMRLERADLRENDNLHLGQRVEQQGGCLENVGHYLLH
jgi:hypothetical protein